MTNPQPQAPLFAGFALYHPQTKEQLLSADEVRGMVRYELPADLSPGMGPTLLPFDRVIITPTTAEQLPDNALLLVTLREPAEAVSVGRLIRQGKEELVLSDEKQSELIRIKQGNVVGLWSIKHLVFRQLR